jgi:hypothetical protein
MQGLLAAPAASQIFALCMQNFEDNEIGDFSEISGVAR